MAELVLRIRVDPTTGKRILVVDYASDSDALPIEHEDEHRRLASAVVEGGLSNQGVSVSRETETAAAESGGQAAPSATPTASKT